MHLQFIDRNQNQRSDTEYAEQSGETDRAFCAGTAVPVRRAQ